MEFLHTILQVYTFISVVFTTFFLIGLIKNLRAAFKNEHTAEVLERVKNHLKLVYKEQVGNTYYLYEQTTHNFIAQGTTEDEMWANAHLTCPSRQFIIEGDNGKAVLVSIKSEENV